MDSSALGVRDRIKGDPVPLFTTLTPERISQEIGAAKRRVILAAPGILSTIADSIILAHQRLPRGSIQVVLDVSAAVSRLGYGEHGAVDRLVKAGISVRQEPGLRLGVLICDDHGWSYASAARLVEAEPTEEAHVCNAIALTEAQVLALRAELPAATAQNQHASEEATPVIGATPVERESLDRVQRALEIAPPQQFDLARQTSVYHAFVQFAELTFEGFSLQSRRVKLPNSLPVIASRDRALKNRISASLKLLDSMEKPPALKDIEDRLEDLRKAYLLPVGKAGRVILKGKRAEFEDELAQIQNDLKQCTVSLKGDIEIALNNVMESLVPDLSRAVLSDPPARFRGLYQFDQASAETFVREELMNSFPNAEDLVQGMKVHKFYKDVTYETLKDEEFETRVKALIPPSVLNGALLNENMAAESVKGDPK